MFKVGDRVEVIDSVHMYSQYKEWFAKQELPSKSKYCHHRKELENGIIAKIIYMNMHLSDDIMLYVLEVGNGDIFLVNEKAIKLDKPLPDTIKITKWEDINKMTSYGDYWITIFNAKDGTNAVEVYLHGKLISSIAIGFIKDDAIIEHLKNYGLLVELIPQIKLSEKDYHMAMALDDGWVCCNNSGAVGWSSRKPERCGDCWTGCGGEYKQLPVNRFPFITWESEPVAVSELQKKESE